MIVIVRVRAITTLIATGSLAIGVGVSAAAPGYPKNVIEHAASGDTTADFFYVKTGQPFPAGYAEFKIRIAHDGQVSYFDSINCSLCSPASNAALKSSKSVRIARLAPGQEPIVIVDLYTDGAHCCSVSEIYVWTGAGYGRINEDWGDPGYTLTDIRHDGSHEFLSADDRFAYTFTDYAHSVMPIQIWKLEDGRLIDVTSTFPTQVKRDAALLWRYYEQAHATHDGVRGVLAAWAADEARLGQWGHARSVLLRPSVLRDIEHDNTYIAVTTPAASYLAQLHAFLRKYGYLNAAPKSKPALRPKPKTPVAGTPTNPIPVGAAGSVAGGWTITVDSALADATAQVEAADPTNPAPPAGSQDYMLVLTAEYDGTATGDFYDNLVLNAVGASGGAYDTLSCGTTLPAPDLETNASPIAPAGSVTGNVCFQVATADVSSLRLSISEGPGTKTTWFALPTSSG